MWHQSLYKNNPNAQLFQHVLKKFLVWLWNLLKFVYIAPHFILLQLNPFHLSVDREGWWFEDSLSQLWVCLSADSARNFSWPRLSLLRGWSSFTMAFTSTFVYIAHHFALLRLYPFDLNVENSFLALTISAPPMGSLTIAFTGKFVYIAHLLFMTHSLWP